MSSVLGSEGYEDGDLLTQLTRGFEALMGKVEDLVAKNARLERQVQDYHQELYSHGEQSPVDSNLEAFEGRNQGNIVETEWQSQHQIAKGIDAWKKLRNPGTDAVPLNKERQKKFAQYLKSEQPHSRLEQDFTTEGPKGDLKCPFAEMIDRRMSQEAASMQERPDLLPTPPDIKKQLEEDPIAAEFHGQAFSSPPPSANGSASKCPIRYLENHSPEEVAKYFENHKHEIPRSHAVCVKRYQSNSESIRELDAKYGNLVNMIQGLGMKHKAMLPAKEEDEMMDYDQKSMEKVAKWAENCEDGPDADIIKENALDEDLEVRSGHFERPLQEVRLGESPSRPWGIRVPLTENVVLSADGGDEVESDTAQSIVAAKEEPATPAPRCPFGHVAPKAPTAIDEDKSDIPISTEPTNIPKVERQPDRKPAEILGQTEQPRIVFNGPVFFGYPADKASELMRSLQQS